jgi:hypothetical protein
MEASGEMISYRPVSRLAVAAAVVGALSSLAITTPLLWALPLVGVALAIAGLMDVTRSGAVKAGRVAALAGLALSVGFGAQAVTTSVVSHWIMESRARAVINAWLDALAESRLADARSMISPQLLPQSESDGHRRGDPGHGQPGHSHHPGEDAGATGSIDSLPAVQAILRCGTAAVRTVRFTGRDEETGNDWCAQVRLSPCAGGGAVDLRLQLMPFVANEPRGRVERWTITKIDLGF